MARPGRTRSIEQVVSPAGNLRMLHLLRGCPASSPSAHSERQQTFETRHLQGGSSGCASGPDNSGAPRLERVKGIEPSYSAWKAAALPLSYTRVTGSLTRPGGGLNCPGRRFAASSPALPTAPVPADRPPLNSGGKAAYIEVFRNQRKEVIQCLLPSAVTSLGSPAKL